MLSCMRKIAGKAHRLWLSVEPYVTPLNWFQGIAGATVVAALTAFWSWVVSTIQAVHALGWGVWLVLGLVLAAFSIITVLSSFVLRNMWSVRHSSRNTDEVPEAVNPLDEDALHDLTEFVTDFVIPAGCAQIDLQAAIIRNSYVNDALASLAVGSIMSNPAITEFGGNFMYLWNKFGSSPMEMVPLAELKKRTLILDKSYQTICDQAYQLAAGAGLDCRTYPALAPRWEEWRQRHNRLVDAYRAIKRDRRFAPELYRPGIEGPWTRQVPAFAPTQV